MTRKEMRASAYEKLMEAMRLLASAGLPLLSEEVEELALQLTCRPPTNLNYRRQGSMRRAR